MDGNFIKVNHIPSSNQSQCWYDLGNRVLKIMYPNGVYLYSNVPPELVDRLQEEAVSVGSFLRAEISSKPDLYPPTKL